jgi:hypothetical protein
MIFLEDIVMLRRVYGDDAATATMVRNILAPVAGLQHDASDLHRRCVLVEHIRNYEDVLASFAPFGPIQAVATWFVLHVGVVVFEDAAAAAATIALQGPAKLRIGLCKAVPSLDLAVAYHFIPPADIDVSGSAIAPAGTPPELDEKARALAFREMCERKPMIEYLDPTKNVCGQVRLGITDPPGTKDFMPSMDSLVHGPTRGSDGHLWMHGDLTTSSVWGIGLYSVSVRVRQEQVGSTKIRVTPLEPIVYVRQPRETWVDQFNSL